MIEKILRAFVAAIAFIIVLPLWLFWILLRINGSIENTDESQWKGAF